MKRYIWWGIMAGSESQGMKFRKLEQLGEGYENKSYAMTGWEWCLMELQKEKSARRGKLERDTFTVTEMTQLTHQESGGLYSVPSLCLY